VKKDHPAGGTLGSRLGQAIQQWRGRGIKAFQQEMKARGVPGSSYPMVHRYLKNAAVPPIPFVTAAAELLGVRASWLTYGDGEPTDAEQAAAAAVPTDPDERVILDAIRESFPLIDRAEWWDRAAVLRAARTLMRFMFDENAILGIEARNLAHDAGLEVGAALTDAQFWFLSADDLDSPVTLAMYLSRATELLNVQVAIARLRQQRRASPDTATQAEEEALQALYWEDETVRSGTNNGGADV
jgi:hypothetical protein